MGRKKAALLAALMVLSGMLAGCGREPAAPSSEEVSRAVQKPFEAAADIQMGGVAATVDLNRTEDEVFSFVFHEPKALDGMTVTMDDENIGLSYLGLHIEADSEDVLNSAVTKAIVAAINQAAEPEGITVGVEGSAVTVSGETDAGEFTLTLDQKNQSLLTLSIPNLDLECRFSGGQ